MSLRDLDKQRLNHLEELLEIGYEKLATFEKELQITSSSPNQFELKQRLKRELIPDILKFQAEYIEILSQNLEAIVIPDTEVGFVLAQVRSIAERLQGSQTVRQYPDLEGQIVYLNQKLDSPNIAPAAKLKFTVPLLPGIVSYEFEIETKDFLVRAGKQLHTSLKNLWK
ncbi:MAG: hypothetical protein NW224_12810 [Leptolyngbyaceae cyanobacterium bins.302]|nr:hypothetical protein [Leptolyngbyaceae cyanobacterium bins.302]